MMNRKKDFILLLYVIYSCLFMVIPILSIFFNSFKTRDIYGGFIDEWSLKAWIELLDFNIFRVIGRTIFISSCTTLICIIVSYFLIVYLINKPILNQYKIITILAIVIGIDPMVKIAGWMMFLGTNGVLNKLLLITDLSIQPKEFLFNQLSLILILSLNYLPFMVVSIWVSIYRMNLTLILTAKDLGANNFQIFKNIIFPLSKKGLVFGIIFVWTSNLTSFVFSEMIGGIKAFSLGKLISIQYFEISNWSLGCSLSIISCIISITFSFFSIKLLSQKKYD